MNSTLRHWIASYRLEMRIFEELAQNGRATRGRCGRVSERFGDATGGLCASDRKLEVEDFSQMKSGAVLTLTLLIAALCAQADFSYTTTRKTTGGAMAAMAGGASSTAPSKYYLKGQKMKVDS